MFKRTLHNETVERSEPSGQTTSVWHHKQEESYKQEVDVYLQRWFPL